MTLNIYILCQKFMILGQAFSSYRDHRETHTHRQIHRQTNRSTVEHDVQRYRLGFQNGFLVRMVFSW